MTMVCDGMLNGEMMSGMMQNGIMGGDGMLAMMQNGLVAMGQMMQGGMMGGGMGPWMLVGWIVPLLVLGGLGALAVWAIRKLAATSESGDRGHDALDVARERYARGEIDRNEFRAIRSDLASG